MSTLALYPGTFDPITLGHLDIIRRAADIFSRVIVAPARHSGKHPLFDLATRTRLVQAAVETLALSNVEVISFTGLLVDFAHEQQASIIIRGLRAVSDFEYEMQLAGLNREMAPNIDTIFIAASPEYQFLSSSMVREICRLGGDVERFVPTSVQAAMQAQLHASSDT